MEKLTRKVLEKMLKEKWVWAKGTPKKPTPPKLRYHEIRLEIEKRKESLYYDAVLFPTYHRFVHLLEVLIDDKEYKDLHFEEVEGEIWFGADCPQCQGDVDNALDRILTRFVENNPEWRQEYPTDEEIDSMNPPLPTHQIGMF